MTPFAHAMLILFIIAWFVGVGGWFYGTRFFLPIWANGFQKSASRDGYGRKALKGYAVFIGAVVFALAVGGLAQLAGGWGQ
jgi:4-hydroxybenzoate polyprenyltransferase